MDDGGKFERETRGGTDNITYYFNFICGPVRVR
jgi:hypothetical protein